MLPSDLSVILYAVVLNHFVSGAYYPRGGSSEIVYQIIPIIERYGGRVLVDAPVSKILINESGRAHGKMIKSKPFINSLVWKSFAMSNVELIELHMFYLYFRV